MEEKNEIITNQLNTESFLIKKILEKYKDNTHIKLLGKKLHYIKDIIIIQFYCIIYKSTEINPFNDEIYINFEFREKEVPYIHILNDFITPTLNDGRNIYYCLTNKHKYKFKIYRIEEFYLLFHQLIKGLKNFFICLKENLEINVFIFYGEYKINRIYQINDFLLNKNTVKFYRIININGKNEEIKYFVITQLFFLVFEPLNDDMSLAKLERYYYLKDINFSLGITYRKNYIECFNLKIVDEAGEKSEESIVFDFLFSENIKHDDDNKNNKDEIKYNEFKQILFFKKNEINYKKYKIIITNYKPLFTIDINKINKNRSIENSKMYNDYKLYISYFEELINYYKDSKVEKIKKRIKTIFDYLNYCCVDFITFNNSNPEEVKLYQSKILKYMNIIKI